EYREFLSFYPTHERAFYAQFKLGMAHFYQMHSSDRDQTETREAIAELTKYVTTYADKSTTPAETTAEVRKHLREAKDHSVASQSAPVFFYNKPRGPPGAIPRLDAILMSDPDYSNRDAVYFYLAQSYVKMKRPAEALPLLDRLLKEFQQSEYLEEARKLEETLKADMTKKTE